MGLHPCRAQLLIELHMQAEEAAAAARTAVMCEELAAAEQEGRYRVRYGRA